MLICNDCEELKITANFLFYETVLIIVPKRGVQMMDQILSVRNLVFVGWLVRLGFQSLDLVIDYFGAGLNDRKAFG